MSRVAATISAIVLGGYGLVLLGVVLAIAGPDLVFHMTFTVPFGVGVLAGLLLHRFDHSQLLLVNVGSILFIAGTVALFLGGLVFAPVGALVFGFAGGVVVRARVWPLVGHASAETLRPREQE